MVNRERVREKKKYKGDEFSFYCAYVGIGFNRDIVTYEIYWSLIRHASPLVRVH